MLFVLVDPFVDRYPSDVLAMSFVPPAIRRKRVGRAIRRYLLTQHAQDFYRPHENIRPGVRPQSGVTYRIRIMVLRRCSFAWGFQAPKCFRSLLSRPLPNAIVKVNFTYGSRLCQVFQVVRGPNGSICVHRRGVDPLVYDGATSRTC